MPPRCVDHANTICCVCKNNKTASNWYKYYDKKGNWNKTSYVCNICYKNMANIHDSYMHDKFTGIKCCKCEKETGRKWHRYYDDKGYWDRKSYLCDKCYLNIYYHNIRKFDPESGNNIIKCMRLCRNKSLSIHTNTGIGFVHEQTVAIVRGLKNCNLELDNFNAKFDLSIDPEYGRIQVKGKKQWFGDWSIHFGMEHNFDTLFILCKSKDNAHVERMYIIPEKELYGIIGLTILGNNNSKWEKFRVDEGQYDCVYHHILSNLKNCPVLKNSKKEKGEN